MNLEYAKFWYQSKICQWAASIEITLFSGKYQKQGQKYGDYLHIEAIDHDNFSLNSQKFDNTPLSPCMSQRLPWDIKPSTTKTRPNNAKTKRRKFVVVKRSKLKALAIIFILLALLVLSFQVSTKCISILAIANSI